MEDDLDKERFTCCRCGKTDMRAIDGTWPMEHSDGTPYVDMSDYDDRGFIVGYETFTCYDCAG